MKCNIFPGLGIRMWTFWGSHYFTYIAIIRRYYLLYLYVIFQTPMIPVHPLKHHIIDIVGACPVTLHWGSVTHPSAMSAGCFWAGLTHLLRFMQPKEKHPPRDAWVRPWVTPDWNKAPSCHAHSKAPSGMRLRVGVSWTSSLPGFFPVFSCLLYSLIGFPQEPRSLPVGQFLGLSFRGALTKTCHWTNFLEAKPCWKCVMTPCCLPG